MAKRALTTFVPRPAHGVIIVVTLPDHPVQGRWHAQKIINALRAKLPLDSIEQDVVVVAGEPGGSLAALGSSPEAEAFIRAVAADLPTYKWQAKELDL
ncbi:MAG: hypothetical protein J0H71_06635 [Rhizobiales bacterium]|nr:hypothetical protein [Hyphomicrobiales bacterium]